MTGRLLALTIVVVTAALITIGTLVADPVGVGDGGPQSGRSSNGSSGSASPQAAAQSLMQLISREKLGRSVCLSGQ